MDVHLSLEEVTEHAGHKVLMEVDFNGVPHAGDPQGILCQKLRPHTLRLFNSIIIILHILN